MQDQTKKDSRLVVERFVESFNELRYRKVVKTKKEFCEAVGIATQSNLNRMIAEGSMNEPTITNILLLHKKFNVSLDWLFLGKGEFFEENR
ncbi:helix-turn-helix transcriptional regulator [Dysgonomonas sp. Marseille-P4677]|uniref:helix-turn-helix domain-containing protein n=1 Tax=Dysgonomonas sp. Marseille-P4677 TaxID=2364790 RepID=UPI00191404BD|nr:helix-turn-helix transcriptional regulator [Dysgonomonas sp. Marseille-P4677]MBK5722450.1 helix-turn-helix transcriptional regulator [Dysgonomonas sp. Marseille-P4677]